MNVGCSLAMVAGLALGTAACDGSQAELPPGRYTIGGILGDASEPLSAAEFDFYTDWDFFLLDMTVEDDGKITGQLTDYDYIGISSVPSSDLVAFYEVTGSANGNTFEATATTNSYGEITVSGSISETGEISVEVSGAEEGLVGAAIGVQNGEEVAVACGDIDEIGFIEDDYYDEEDFAFMILNDGELTGILRGPHVEADVAGTLVYDPEDDISCESIEGCIDEDSSSLTVTGLIDIDGEEEVNFDLDLDESYANSEDEDLTASFIQIYAEGEDDDEEYFINIDIDSDDCINPD